VDGQNVIMDSAPEMSNSRTMVPVRFVSESLGAGVDWDEYTETVKITAGGVTNPVYNVVELPPPADAGQVTEMTEAQLKYLEKKKLADERKKLLDEAWQGNGNDSFVPGISINTQTTYINVGESEYGNIEVVQ